MNRDDMMQARSRLQAVRAADRNITVVLGPPCSGKTTYINQHRRPSDIVIDFDALATALGSEQPWDHSPQHVRMTQTVRAAAITRALGDPQSEHIVWIILTDRRQATEFALHGARTIELDTPLDECERRATALNRSANVIALIRSYQSRS